MINLVKKTPAFQKVKRLFLEEVKSGRKCLRRKKSKKVPTQKLQKEDSEEDLLANLIKRKAEKLPRQLRIMCETEFHQILLKYKMQVFQNTTISAEQACQNVLP